MDLLQEARKTINEVDREMAALFVRRMQAVQKVAEYKKAHGLPIYDEKREEEVLRSGAERVEDETLRGDYIDFMRATMAVSRRYQQRLMDSADRGRITVELGKNSYTVTVLRGALACAEQYMNLSRKVLVVTDSGVPASYAKTVAAQCKDAVVVTIPQGESNKNLENYKMLCSTMLERGFTRTDCVVAVGGGVVGDLAGFAAATFMRGIDFYNIPTTLLSQVDSSVGGKTAIDLDGIKNCVGAFHQPKAVLIDPDVLKTLPQRQMANGLAEVVKMAVNFDEDLLSLLEGGDFLSRMEEIIAASVRIKASVVKADEKEAGLRRVLNFGHTIGHGIETAAAGALYHGECVALGMLPMCEESLRNRVKALLQKLGLPVCCQVDPDGVWAAICHDKKLSGDQITVVYAPEAGSFRLRSMPVEAFKETVYTFLEGGKAE